MYKGGINLRICQINNHDIANGPGVRASIYVSGCTFNCPECHNPEAQNFKYGNVYGYKEEAEIMNTLYPHYITGLSILGGEPLHPKNISTVSHICELVRFKFHHDKSIWLWTGFTAEELLDSLKEFDKVHKLAVTGYPNDLYRVLQCIDVIIDGRYEKDKHDYRLKFRGSSNQRILKANDLLDKKITIIPDEDI